MNSNKRVFMGLFGVFLGSALMIVSCTSYPQSASQNSSNPYGFVEDLQLAKGQVFYKDMVSTEGGVYTASAFSVANNFLDMDNYLELTHRLEPDQQANLAAALFKDLPVRTDSGDVRMVVVGDYYGEGKNLIIFIYTVNLIQGKVPGKDLAYKYHTNALNFKTVDKETNKTSLLHSGLYLNSKSNYTRLAIPYEQGNLVFSNNLTINRTSYESATTDADLGNLMDTVLKDEFADNDELAREAYEALITKD
ncbi:MAG: hypothetical protein SNJ71_05725, partial [Bacteroidales bacterium]